MTDKWSIYRNPITKYWIVRDPNSVYLFPTGASAHKAFNHGNVGR